MPNQKMLSRAELEEIPLVLASELRAMTLSEALAVWLPSRVNFLSPKTYKEYGFCQKRLREAKIGDLRLDAIAPDHIRQYQSLRLAAGCGAHGINHECSLLQQILKRAGLWKERLDFDYQPLPLPKTEVGYALTADEQERLLKVASSRADWEGTYCFLLLSLNTTLGPKEALTLRRMDINLANRTLRVTREGAKNVHRIRTIPLNEVAYGVCVHVLGVAEKRGSTEPHHYVFPFRIKGNTHGGKYDPLRHQRSFRTAWEQIRIAAGLPNFRQYDCRHTAISVMYECPDNSEETIEQIAGHGGSVQMKKRYAHIRMDAKRTALSRLGEESSAMRKARKPGDFQPQKPLENRDVLDLVESGLPEDVIVAKIKKANCAFETSPQDLKMLKALGLPTAVILAMVEAA